MKALKIGAGVLIIAAIGAAIYFKDKLPGLDSSFTPAPPPPASDDPKEKETPILSRSDPRLTSAIAERMKLIYNNEREREDIYRLNGVRSKLFNSLRYPAGIRQSIAGDQGGSPSDLPVVPPSLNPDYSDRLRLITELTTIEKLDRSIGLESALNQWRNAADMGELGFSFFSTNLKQLIDQGAFYESSRKDKNKSERWDSWSKDLQVLAENIIEANKKAESAIEQKAIDSLISAGWKIEGFSYA